MKLGPIALVTAVLFYVGGGSLGGPALASPPIAWQTLRVGLLAYTSTDGGDSSVQTICRSESLAIDAPGGASPGCWVVKPGVAVIIDEIHPVPPMTNGGIPIVRIHAVSGAWSGYADPTIMQSDVPVGAEGVVSVGATLWKTAAVDSGPTLDAGARVRVLKFVPTNDDGNHAPLYVVVLTGAERGKRGWLLPVGVASGPAVLGTVDWTPYASKNE